LHWDALLIFRHCGSAGKWKGSILDDTNSHSCKPTVLDPGRDLSHWCEIVALLGEVVTISDLDPQVLLLKVEPFPAFAWSKAFEARPVDGKLSSISNHCKVVDVSGWIRSSKTLIFGDLYCRVDRVRPLLPHHAFCRC
jgi:hypothetical protein